MPRNPADASKQRRDRRLLLKFFVATSLLALLPFGVARWRRSQPKTPYTFPFAELAALDKVVQARFAVVPDNDFGLGRIGKRHEVFVPQTAEEKSVIAALKRDGYEVVFYVAGRDYLTNGYGRLGPPFLQGPIFITDKTPSKKPTPYDYLNPHSSQQDWVPIPKGLPDGGDLLHGPLKAPAQNAYSAFETSEGTDFVTRGWNVVARPVRASQEGCLDCHRYYKRGKFILDSGWRTPAIGDTLGVAMYAYRTKTKGQK